ncbi:MAG: heavy-metal-associated domain-containing protein [Dehalococcoidia bacterium]
MATYEATLPGITCDGCIGTLKLVARIENGIESIDGKAADRTVSVEYDESEIGQSDVEAWLTRSGYPPSN